MPFHFCPQCGTKLQPGFRFCPSCGEQLSSSFGEPGAVSSTPSLSLSPPKRKEAASSVVKTSPASSTSCAHTETLPCTLSTVVTTRPALQKTRNSLRLNKDVSFTFKGVPLPMVPSTKPVAEDRVEAHTVPFQHKAEVEPTLKPSPSTPTKSPRNGKSKAKKARHSFYVEPLNEGDEMTDTTGKKWKLGKLLTQNSTEIIYEVLQTVSRFNSKESSHILKLGAKDGRIFNEQNFLQRAAKPASVDKWIKLNKMDFLGIPSCVGFGPHAESYRFLVFPDMGQCLQSVMMEKGELLSEKAVLQLACRILDVLQYIHSNEYVHGDINAENIYIKPEQKSLVYLVGYCHAFRYCPGGKHVEYREASRTPHEGTTEFISLDAHKGAAPSRRSDLQSLGYCMLRWHTGTLPWMALTNPDQVATQKQKYMEDVSALLSHCLGKKRVSTAFQTFLTAVMALQYSEQPDYSVLKSTLKDALLGLGGSLEQPLSF